VAEDLWRGDADLVRRWSSGAVPQCLVLVAVASDQEILGVAVVQLREELLSHEPSAHLEVLVVRPGAEGHGIGQRLVREAEQAAAIHGAGSLSLHVFSRNVRARALYERLGFTGELIRYLKYLGKPDHSGPPEPMPASPIPGRVVALCGSLRFGSSNSALLDAAIDQAPVGMRIVRFDRLGQLPHFNPDADTADPVAPVAELRREVGAAEGLIISSPEYAHGVPGVLKNALDWLVGGIEVVGKPVLLLRASDRAAHAQASLRETLTTMAAMVLPGALAGQIRPSLDDLLRAMVARREERSR